VSNARCELEHRHNDDGWKIENKSIAGGEKSII
jgi:hypothetical protein